MTSLVLGLILFLGIHSVSIVAPLWRDRVAARIGNGTWRAIYSIVSLVGLVLMIRGYALARLHPVQLYSPLSGRITSLQF